MRRLFPVCWLALALATPSPAATWAWVDDEGVTHITDDPAAVPEQARPGRDGLRGLWSDAVATTPAAPGPVPGGDRERDRVRRLIQGAAADLARGENARATVALAGVLRDHPGDPEAHWYLALLDRERGRYESAEVHLRAFLASAGDDYGPWRASAQRRLAALVDERRLADETLRRAPDRWEALASDHFRVSYDRELGEASPGYAETALRYLQEARRSVAERLGAVPAEPMGVLFYGKAAYLQAYRHRFSFQTVGFFDGRIHVVSAAHPAGELRSLLFHEYTHAVFREQTGGDRPYWLNEGLAELSERDSKGRSGLTRSERAALRARIDEDRWIPLRQLAPSFSGLDDEDARSAYLESTAAAHWLVTRTAKSQRARLLQRLGQGESVDGALREATGLDTDGLETAVRDHIRAEFPASDGLVGEAGGF